MCQACQNGGQGRVKRRERKRESETLLHSSIDLRTRANNNSNEYNRAAKKQCHNYKERLLHTHTHTERDTHIHLQLNPGRTNAVNAGVVATHVSSLFYSRQKRATTITTTGCNSVSAMCQCVCVCQYMCMCV